MTSSTKEEKSISHWGLQDLQQNAPTGLKYDKDKPRFDLIDAYATEELARVLTFGAKKYKAHNWREGIEFSRLIAAAKRHINAIEKGDDLDEETGLSHAAHAMCCMMFLTWMQRFRPDLDDRYKLPEKRPLSLNELLTRLRTADAAYKKTISFVSELTNHKPSPIKVGAHREGPIRNPNDVTIKTGDELVLFEKPGRWRVTEIMVEKLIYNLRSSQPNQNGVHEDVQVSINDILGVLI
jgi:hypothetical protein